ncbi:hypothetical protein [Nocardioides sp. GXZ039]|uniref:hypothetical protein n=1 Tax=Nocardioides sp. GXZ039 TaxID=3136018 RepID=UPI0030F3EEFC
MNTMTRRLAAVGAPVLLALSLSACGGGPGDDAPKDASQEDFCKAFLEQAQDSTAKEWADSLAKVGTPGDIGGEERKGFEVFVNELSDLDDKKLSEVGDVEVSKDDEKAGTAFVEWAAETCVSASLPEDLGSPTE